MEASLNDKDVLEQRYKLRMAGGRGGKRSTYVISLPKSAVLREARRLGIDEKDATEKLVGCWRFNGFVGLRLVFELKNKGGNK